MAEVKYAIDRRTEILKAAREVLAEKGLDAAKISEIVARAGVAQGTFYLYFPSKTSLVLALVDELTTRNLDAVRSAIDGAPSMAQAIDRGVRAVFANMAKDGDIAGIIHSRMGLMDIRAECEKKYEPMHSFVAEMIRLGIESGEVDPSVNPEISARLVTGVIENAVDHCYVFGALEPSEALIAELVRFVQRSLGVRTPAVSAV